MEFIPTNEDAGSMILADYVQSSKSIRLEIAREIRSEISEAQDGKSVPTIAQVQEALLNAAGGRN